MSTSSSYEYHLGGTLPINAPSYVERQADQRLYESLIVGEFCYVLNARQMGKSSLRVRTMQRLREAGVSCASIDITAIGTRDITSDQLYASVVDSIVNNLQSNKLDNWQAWWESQRLISPIQRFENFIDQVLLEEVEDNVVIFIDEIDSVLSLSFDAGDFFAAIRDCYNRRADQPKYNKLTFALLGVATPSDLIQDKRRTPFNIGQAIELTGFSAEEAQPLIPGLATKAQNPQAVLAAILSCTGGQPFLTQKICLLIYKRNINIPAEKEAESVRKIVQMKVISNWESQDEPIHLRTIQKRLSSKGEQLTGKFLGVYQQILEQGYVDADDSPEQVELRLSGLVVKQSGYLKVYNAIYKAVFNSEWVGEELKKIRPYAESIKAWLGASCEDDSRLLRGQALREALGWMQGKEINPEDQDFIRSSLANFLLEDRRCIDALSQYQKVLAGKWVSEEEGSNSQIFLELAILEIRDKRLTVTHDIYLDLFNEDWVQQVLTEAQNRRIIRKRYEVVSKLSSNSPIKAYLVRDLDLAGKPQYIIKHLNSAANNLNLLEHIKDLFHNRLKDFEKIRGHEKIPNLIAFFEEDGEFYIVQDFIEGSNLDAEIAPFQRWEEEKVIDFLIDICEVLGFIHRQGLAHLNLKPSNIRRKEIDKSLTLIDFGILQEIMSLVDLEQGEDLSEDSWTLDYYPPEEISEWSDEQRDIYALGMIAIQALTGNYPYELNVDRKTREVIWRYSVSNQPMVDIRPEFADVIDKMVSHKISGRHRNIDKILADLHELKKSPRQKNRGILSFKTHHAVMLGSGVLSLLALTCFGAFKLYERNQTYQAFRRDLNLCQELIQAPEAYRDSLINLEVDSIAGRHITACETAVKYIEGKNISVKNDISLSLFVRQGQARIIQWIGKSDSTKEEFLKSAIENFQTAVNATSSTQEQTLLEEGNKTNVLPQTFFYLGLAQNMEQFEQIDQLGGTNLLEDIRYNNAHERAIQQYIDIPFRELSDEDIPILGTLASLLFQASDYGREEFEVSILLLEKAIEKSNSIDLKADSLNYNLAVVHARGGNYREAERLYNSGEFLDNSNAFMSLGFIHLIFSSEEWPLAVEAFEKALDINPRLALAEKYRDKLQVCLSGDATCNRAELTRDAIKETEGLEKVFPLAPIYQCGDYPVLAIAEQVAEKYNLERRLDNCELQPPAPEQDAADN
ncbi:MAG: AAA-like domain-containing protein [Cyanobacteria bacterium P01_F01_bin.56]